MLTGLYCLSEAYLHILVDIQQPIFHGCSSYDVAGPQVQHFSLGRNKSCNRLAFGIVLEFNDILKALAQIWLQGFQLLHLGKDFEDLVVGQEKETLEVLSLFLQEFVQHLLDSIENRIVLAQSRESPLVVGPPLGSGVLVDFHNFLPGIIRHRKELALFWQVFSGIGRIEDRLQIEPVALMYFPLIKQFLQRFEELVLLLNLFSDNVNVAAGQYVAYCEHAIVHLRLQLLVVAEDKNIGFVFEGYN